MKDVKEQDFEAAMTIEIERAEDGLGLVQHVRYDNEKTAPLEEGMGFSQRR